MNTTTNRPASSYFERETREDGEAFYTLTDDAPEWLRDAVMAAHDGELPNDWRYDTCHSIVSSIEDGATDDHEIADGLVDIYNAARLQWLADDVTRTAYCDEAQSEGLTGEDADVVELAGIGQYVAIQRMADILLSAVIDNRADES